MTTRTPEVEVSALRPESAERGATSLGDTAILRSELETVVRGSQGGEEDAQGVAVHDLLRRKPQG